MLRGQRGESLGEADHEIVWDPRRAPQVVESDRLLDLDAVTRALEAEQLSAVALDVFEAEPLSPDHPLRRHPRALITPHMAFYSEEAERELRRRGAEEVARAVRGEPPRCPVNHLPDRR